MPSPTSKLTTTIHIRLFGPEAAAAGRSSIPIEASEGSTCETLRDRLAEQHPQLRPLLKTIRFAVNSEFVPLTHIIRQGDEVALIGLVSGG